MKQVHSKNRPKWLRDYLKSYRGRKGRSLDSIEEIKFKNNNDIFLSDLLPDIQKAMNKETLMRFSIQPLRKPNFISLYQINRMDSKDEIQLGIEVRDYSESDTKDIPFCGFLIFGEYLIVAEETDDSTAELCLKLLELIWRNNLTIRK